MVIKFIKVLDGQHQSSYISAEFIHSDNKNNKFNTWHDMEKFLEKLDFNKISVMFFEYFSDYSDELDRIHDLLDSTNSPPLISGRIMVHENIHDQRH